MAARCSEVEHYAVSESVRPSVCHTRDSRLNGSGYRDVLCTSVVSIF